MIKKVSNWKKRMVPTPGGDPIQEIKPGSGADPAVFTIPREKPLGTPTDHPQDLGPLRRPINWPALEKVRVAATNENTAAGLSLMIEAIEHLADQAAEATQRANQMVECSLKAIQTTDQLTKTVKVLLEENRLIAVKVNGVMNEIALAFQEQVGGVH